MSHRPSFACRNIEDLATEVGVEAHIGDMLVDLSRCTVLQDRDNKNLYQKDFIPNIQIV